MLNLTGLRLNLVHMLEEKAKRLPFSVGILPFYLQFWSLTNANIKVNEKFVYAIPNLNCLHKVPLTRDFCCWNVMHSLQKTLAVLPEQIAWISHLNWPGFHLQFASLNLSMKKLAMTHDLKSILSNRVEPLSFCCILSSHNIIIIYFMYRIFSPTWMAMILIETK